MKLVDGMWVLVMNDMRFSQIQDMAPVACAVTRVELENFLAAEKVDSYTDTNENRRDDPPASTSPFGSTHGMNKTWGKSYRKGGPLEWYNQPVDLERQLFQYRAPEVPLISELAS